MLQPIMHILASQRVILASGSPRRKQILQNVGLKFEVVPSKFEENLDKNIFNLPKDYVIETARQKTLEVAERLRADKRPPDLIIGADTVVTMDEKIYEKPKSTEHAFEMLSGVLDNTSHFIQESIQLLESHFSSCYRFSGRRHVVYTGVVLMMPSRVGELETHTFHEATEVVFAKVSPEIIRAYVATGEPMDKAGGYGIQTLGGTLVEGIHGDYFNVMGFPLHHFAQELSALYKDRYACM